LFEVAMAVDPGGLLTATRKGLKMPR
jgi:hypothetical protein